MTTGGKISMIARLATPRKKKGIPAKMMSVILASGTIPFITKFDNPKGGEMAPISIFTSIKYCICT